MKPARTSLLVVAAVLATAWVLYSSRTVSPNPSRQSEFIRTYEPSRVVEKFGHLRQTSGGAEAAAGRHGVWNSRNFLFRIEVDGHRVPDLLAAMHHQAGDSITGAGARLAGSGGAGPLTLGRTYTTRYEDAHATGIVIIGPAYPDALPIADPQAFDVPVRIEEQWRPD
jgi:hypothetical protein